MRTSIRHSGGVNDEPYFTFQLVEVGHTSITVNGDTSTLNVEIKERELRDLIVRGKVALETARLNRLLDSGGLTREAYDKAIEELDRREIDPTLRQSKGDGE